MAMYKVTYYIDSVDEPTEPDGAQRFVAVDIDHILKCLVAELDQELFDPIKYSERVKRLVESVGADNFRHLKGDTRAMHVLSEAARWKDSTGTLRSYKKDPVDFFRD